jgi:hypothetical protein
MEFTLNGMMQITQSTVLFTECTLSGLRSSRLSVFSIDAGSIVRMVRTTLRDNRASGGTGCFTVNGAATVEIVDSDIIGCVSDGDFTAVLVASEGSLTITDSRIDGTIGTGKGVIARVEDSATLRIVLSTITNTSGPFAILATGIDFGVQLDTVTVDSTFDLLSHGAVLVQNCDGLSSTAVKNASIGTCGSTADYCIPESCTDQAVGIQCSCFVDGLPTVSRVNA